MDRITALTLSNRTRLPSNGKRQLSPETNSQASFKFPRLDANKVFEKLQGQDSFLEEAKKEIETASNCILASCKPDDGGMGMALTKLASALTNIIAGNEAFKSSLIDLLKSNNNSLMGAPPPLPRLLLASRSRYPKPSTSIPSLRGRSPPLRNPR